MVKHQQSNLCMKSRLHFILTTDKWSMLMLSCNVTVQLWYGSRSGLIHHLWNDELHQNYLQRLSDDIFMWCSRVHFPYGDVRGKTHTDMYCTHRGFSVLLTAAVCVCVCVNHPCHVFKHNLSYILYSNCAAVCIHFCRHIYFCRHDIQCVQLCAGRESTVSVCVSVCHLQCSACLSKMWSLHSCFEFQNCFFSAFENVSAGFFLYTFSVETIVIYFIIT